MRPERGGPDAARTRPALQAECRVRRDNDTGRLAPAALHQAGRLGVIRVIDGRLRYRVLDGGTESILDVDHPGVALPEQLHEIEPLGQVHFFIEFHGRSMSAKDRN